MHDPIMAPADRPTLDASPTADVGLLCGACLETLDPHGRCLNVGACLESHTAAARPSLRRGAAASARPAAWTLGGRVD